MRADENSGETLHHDHVVRRYEPLPAWDAAARHQLRWSVAPAAVPRRVILVLTDVSSQRPVQAVALGC